jgi:hypothetical protein
MPSGAVVTLRPGLIDGAQTDWTRVPADAFHE